MSDATTGSPAAIASTSEIPKLSCPVAAATTADADTLALLDLASRALTGIRRAKTDAKASQKSAVISATIGGPAAEVALLAQASADLQAVGRIAELTFVESVELSVTNIVLATMSEI